MFSKSPVQSNQSHEHKYSSTYDQKQSYDCKANDHKDIGSFNFKEALTTQESQARIIHKDSPSLRSEPPARKIITIDNAKGLEMLTGADLAFLTMMKSPYITAVATFNTKLDSNQFHERITERFNKIDRLWLRPVKDLRGQYYWQPTQTHAFDQQVVSVELHEGDHDTRLREAINTIFQQPIDLQRPLWELHFFQSPNNGKSSFLFRVHHSISDGLGLVGLLLHIMDNGREATIPAISKHSGSNSPERASWTGAAVTALSQPLTTLYQTGKLLLTIGRESYKLGATLFNIATRSADPITPIKRPEPIEHNEIEWLSSPLPLNEIKRIGKATNTTVNDVLLAIIGHTTREYLKEQGHDNVDQTRLRAIMPFNVRKLDSWDNPNEMMRAGNQFSVALLPMTTQVENPLECLLQTHDKTHALRNSWEPALNLFLNPLIPYLPQSVLQTLIKNNAQQCSMMISNVPGPQKPLRMNDTQMDRIMWYMPTFENIGLSFQIISYNGQVYIGITTDRDLIDTPQRLENLLQSSYNQLVNASNMISQPK